MKNIIIAFLLFVGLVSFAVFAEARTTRVRGYYKPSTGSYVAPHYRTTPNRTRLDNFSTQGNYNPYTGKTGSVKPYQW